MSNPTNPFLDLGLWTAFVNMVTLAVALWLGFYIVTRSPRSLISWLAALTLWALAGFFFYHAVSAQIPNIGILNSLWETVIIALPLWFHLTTLLIPRTGRSDSLGNTLNSVGVPVAYLSALMLVVMGQLTDQFLARTPTGLPIYTNYRAPGPIYPLFILFIIVGSVPTFLNLWRGRSATRDPLLRAQYTPLILATALGIGGGLYFAICTEFEWMLPIVIGDLLLASGVVLLGYAIAKYSAFLDGRAMERDFLYTFLAVGSLTVFYVFVVYLLHLAGQVSYLTLVLTVAGTVSANSLFDGVRLTLDRVFYQERFQRLRANLRALAEEAGTSQTLDERLQGILSALCRALRIGRGFIAVRVQDHYVISATWNAEPLGQTIPPETLTAEETMALALPSRKRLQNMQLLVPIYAHDLQIGALVLGAREDNVAYKEHDYELLEDLGDQIASVIHGDHIQQQNAAQLNTLVQEFRERERTLQLQVDQVLSERVQPLPTPANEWDEEKLTTLVEDGLRHLHDFPYLGEHDLSKLRGIQANLAKRGDGSPPTFLDRGKAVSELLIALLDELKPDAPAPKSDQTVSREWHLYTILYDSYVNEEPNREIMSKLYIGEGTFNRARRRALRAVAKSLAELEASAAA